MGMNKQIKHKARDLTGCGWHRRIKLWAKRQSSKNARRLEAELRKHDA